jgi:hypothetical protein
LIVDQNCLLCLEARAALLHPASRLQWPPH